MTTRAVVLGGGGPVGVAWESGLVAGLAQGGLDLGLADFVVGTSAGSIVGARLASGVPTLGFADSLLARPEATAAAPTATPKPERRNRTTAPDISRLFALMTAAQSDDGDPIGSRRALGALALAAETSGEDSVVNMIARSFPEGPPKAWPARGFACTAVDAEDGGFHLWIADSGVDLTRAVASSCSVPGVYAPVTLKGRRYIDGGMRSATNADVAGGYDVVVVIAIQPPGADGVARRLAAEVEWLEAGGAKVVTIMPDHASQEAFGPNLMDFGRSASVARAGVAQGLAQADALKKAWN